MIVKLPLTDLEATEVEYALHYRVNSLHALEGGCHQCKKLEPNRFCELHAGMVEILKNVIDRLVKTGFTLQS